MSQAREKIDGILRHLAQRTLKRQQAEGAWQRSKDRCTKIAQVLLEGTGVEVRLCEDAIQLQTQHGSWGFFAFDPKQMAMVGTRKKHSKEAAEPFFSLKIEPPPRPQGHAVGQWGPSRPEGIGDLSAKAGSLEAFEKAVADWFEWAHVGDGAPPARS